MLKIKRMFQTTLAMIALVTLAACGGMTSVTQLNGERVQGEIVRSSGGMLGDDVTTGVVDYANRNGEWRTKDFLVTSTSFGKMLMPQLIAGTAVARIQQRIAEYQVDNQCNEACGDVINVLAASQSATLTQVQVDAIAQIMNNQGGGH